MKRILKKGGIFITVLYGAKSSGYSSGKQLSPNTFTEIKSGPFANYGHITVFSPSEILELIEKNGFEKLEWEIITTENFDRTYCFEENVLTLKYK
ncbi:MAG: hypothetical protein GY737_22905 [Desulfobacteraceae bacterium]|nr:hypothetical protein [Desulfobacteraceae bacterium]